MSDRPIQSCRKRRFGGVCGLVAVTLLGAGLVPVLAEGSSEGTKVLGVRASSACLKEQVRITGFAVAREEGGASVPLDGYRISEILVTEGDTVTVGQELLRAVRLGGDDAVAGAPVSIRPPGPPIFPLKSPMAGKVTKVNVRVGSLTGATATAAAVPAMPGMPPEPQVRIMAETGIDLLADVPSLYAVKLRTGLTAQVFAEGGADIKGTVRVPVAEVDPATQLGRARLTIEPASALRPGQFASAVVELTRDCGVSVPRSAVSFENGAPTVRVLNGSSVETRSVRTGLFDDNLIQIRDGLSEGDPVVANAGTNLRTGDKVSPVISNRPNGPSR